MATSRALSGSGTADTPSSNTEPSIHESRQRSLETRIGVAWPAPLNYLMIPLGTLLFLINLPTVLGAIRVDPSTASIESRGGLVGRFIPTGSAFNVGNFTFLPVTPPPLPSFLSA